MIQKDYLIIYHREDNDGVFSAAIFEDYLLNKLHLKLEDLVFLGADYNILSEFAKDKHNTPEKLHEDFKHIIMTDISFNDSKFMKDLYNEFGNDFISQMDCLIEQKLVDLYSIIMMHVKIGH